MKPDARYHDPDPDYLKGLIKAAGVSRRRAAQLIGMSDAGLKNYLRQVSDPLYRPAPYAVQYALECLVDPYD